MNPFIFASIRPINAPVICAMKVLLDIKDSKAPFFMELLKNFSFVKAETLVPTKAQFLKDLKGAVEEVALAKQGKKKLQSAEELLDEL